MQGAVNVTNLSDADCDAICHPNGGCARGDPREVQLTLGVSF